MIPSWSRTTDTWPGSARILTAAPMSTPDEDMMRSALTRYRVIAYVVGVVLLVLTYATVRKYTAGDESLVAAVGPVHGLLYMVYLALTFDLGRRARWSPG